MVGRGLLRVKQGQERPWGLMFKGVGSIDETKAADDRKENGGDGLRNEET